MPSIDPVPFQNVPHQTRLFLDYLNLSPGVLAFYDRPPSFQDMVVTARRTKEESFSGRNEITAILRRQNETYGGTAQTMQFIRELENPGSLAVVTGQQVGLFTGPLYTIYKALTAIRLAEELRENGAGAVPIFWMDSEDHDLAEVTRIWTLAPDAVPQMTDFRRLLFDLQDDEEISRPVGSIPFPDSIVQGVDSFCNHLPDSQWKEEVCDGLKAAYRPGSTFTLSFGRLMSDLLGKYGLVLFDPQDPEAKPLVSWVFQQAIEKAPALHAAMCERNKALTETGYHTQVHVLENSTVLFVQDQGERRALTRQDGGFALKNCETRFSVEELVDLARRSPNRFSPNVLLRPIVQDTLFPTIAYVAGPAEIAYFAQIQVLYAFFGRSMPAIWPRASFTLIEPETAEALHRGRIDFLDCLQGKHHVVEKLIAGANHSNTTDILKGLHAYLDRALDEMRPGVVSTDPSLGHALDTAKRKLLHHVEGLQTKFVHLEARHNRSVLEQADRILNHCHPNKTLQERTLGIHHYLASHGPSLVDSLYSLIQIGSFDHKVVRLD